MGGQACIVYGAAEFSRDLDVAVLASTENLVFLRAALAELKIEVARAFPDEVAAIASRPWLIGALKRGEKALEESLRAEELHIRDEDHAYWRPLRAELETMRLAR